MDNYPNINDFLENLAKENISLDTKEKIFSNSLKEYLTILNSEASFENKLKIKIVLEKLKDYKNSLKDLFNLQCNNLCIDNQIDNYIDNIKSSSDKLKEKDLKSFLLDSSIQLYKEIFQNVTK